jgi:hypothetical protein
MNIEAKFGLKDEEKINFWYICLAENHFKDWG